MELLRLVFARVSDVLKIYDVEWPATRVNSDLLWGRRYLIDDSANFWLPLLSVQVRILHFETEESGPYQSSRPICKSYLCP